MVLNLLRGVVLLVPILTGGVALAQQAPAQDIRGFVTAALNPATISQELPGIGLGFAKDFFNAWLSVGGQGDIFLPFVSGRIGPFAQLNVVNRRAIRAFLIGGYALGENGGTRLGAGVDVLPVGRRIGFRTTIQRYRSPDENTSSVEFGLTWK